MNTTLLQKKECKALGVVLICLFFLVISLIGGSVQYASNDDTFLSLIALGAFGPGSEQYLIYSNIVLGLLLKYLYILIPSWNWFLFIVLALTFFAILIICGVLVQTRTFLETIFISVLLNCAFYRDAYIMLNYTKCGYFVFFAGFLLIYDSYKRHSRFWTIGLFMMLFGYMIRSECVLGILPVVGLLILWESCNALYHKEKIKIQGRILSTLVILSLALIVINSFAYSDSAWKTATRFNNARMAIMDHGGDSFDKFEAEYSEIGYTAADSDLLSHWTYADPDHFTAELLEKVSSIARSDGQRNIRLTPSTIKDTFISLGEIAATQPCATITIICLVLLLIVAHNATRLVNFLEN